MIPHPNSYGENTYYRLSYLYIDNNSGLLSSVRLPRCARNDRVESEIVFALWIAAGTGLVLNACRRMSEKPDPLLPAGNAQAILVILRHYRSSFTQNKFCGCCIAHRIRRYC